MTDLFYISVSSNGISKRMQLEILHGKILAQKDNLCQMDLCSVLLSAIRAMIYKVSKASGNVETLSTEKCLKITYKINTAYYSSLVIFLGGSRFLLYQQVSSSWGVLLASYCFCRIFWGANLVLSQSQSNHILLIGGSWREGFFFITFVSAWHSFSSLGMEIYSGELWFPFLPALLAAGGCWSGIAGSGSVSVRRDGRPSKDYG